jgi:quercetin dioxygenase-like cupin family protein
MLPSALSVKMAYGTDTGIMVARCCKGYHSRPHKHDSEQWNYVLDGEIWLCVPKT